MREELVVKGQCNEVVVAAVRCLLVCLRIGVQRNVVDVDGCKVIYKVLGAI